MYPYLYDLHSYQASYCVKKQINQAQFPQIVIYSGSSADDLHDVNVEQIIIKNDEGYLLKTGTHTSLLHNYSL